MFRPQKESIKNKNSQTFIIIGQVLDLKLRCLWLNIKMCHK